MLEVAGHTQDARAFLDRAAGHRPPIRLPDLIVATSAGAITLDVALIQGGEHADLERVVAATAGESERDGKATCWAMVI